MIDRLCDLVLRVYLAAMPAIGILWILSVPDYFIQGSTTTQVLI